VHVGRREGVGQLVVREGLDLLEDLRCRLRVEVLIGLDAVGPVDAEHVEEEELGVRAVTAVVAHQGLLVERGTGGPGRVRRPPRGCGWPPRDGHG
jgi:hypothetical protein